jgi:hypothetical protein
VYLLTQGLILLSAVAVFMAQSGKPRLAAWLGLAAAPAWLWSSWEAGQVGVFIVSVIFALAWARGLR